MTRARLGRAERSDVRRDMTPMRRFAKRNEIALAVLFLASPAATFITVEMILVEGADSFWKWGPSAA